MTVWQKGPNKLNKCSSRMQCLPIFYYAMSPSKKTTAENGNVMVENIDNGVFVSG